MYGANQAEAEDGAELGNKNLDTKIPSFGNRLEYPISNLKLTWVILSEKSGKFYQNPSQNFFFIQRRPAARFFIIQKLIHVLDHTPRSVDLREVKEHFPLHINKHVSINAK